MLYYVLEEGDHMKYKLVAIDMDGTLLNSDNQVSLETRQAIKSAEEKGIRVVISTGRLLESASAYGKMIGLNNPILACNGALIADENGKTLYKKTMDKESVRKIVNLARERDVYFHFYNERNLFSYTRVEEILAYYNPDKNNPAVELKLFEDINDLLSKEDLNIYKFLFIDYNQKKLKDLRAELSTIKNVETSSSWENNVEAMASNVTKGEALRNLCLDLDIRPDEVVAIGDSENDLSMFEFAGLSIAMGNGDGFIKSNAMYTTDTNDNDGVAKAFHKFIF